MRMGLMNSRIRFIGFCEVQELLTWYVQREVFLGARCPYSNGLPSPALHKRVGFRWRLPGFSWKLGPSVGLVFMVTMT